MGYDSKATIRGANNNYDIDTIQVNDSTGDHRQVLVVGDFNVSGVTGACATVDTSALHVSAVGGTVTANLGATDNAVLDSIDTVLDTIKVDTEAIETAVESSVANAGNVLTLKRNVIAPVTGLDVNIKPSTSSYLSHVYIDLDAAGDNPTSNAEVIAAPGAGQQLVIYGIQGSLVGGAASDYGNWYLTDGNAAVATTLWVGRAQGTSNTQFELTFPYGVALTANTALKVTSTEGSGNIFLNAVVYYRDEA